MLVALIAAAAMSLTMWAIARHEADASMVRTFLIAFGVAVVTAISSIFLGIFALAIGFLLAAWAVRQFCYLRWPHAFVVAAVFVAVQFGGSFVMHLLKS
ncbi:MAG: hypothetical protein H7A49_00465 [Akkermansiaceae bacterium]|nr:hypothetical protein [Akkermansiaceae bacterium]MCP5542354.1 hypothetical protein [Akkermansiaceae bacterium]MCP5546111.1 hypothetical protein [Akkermansiaceae bacterium]